jgi:hypothetical protein
VIFSHSFFGSFLRPGDQTLIDAKRATNAKYLIRVGYNNGHCERHTSSIGIANDLNTEFVDEDIGGWRGNWRHGGGD